MPIEKTKSYLEVVQSWPVWVQILVGSLVLAAGLWIFSKVLKVAVWVAIVVVVLGGIAAAVWYFLHPGETPHL